MKRVLIVQVILVVALMVFGLGGVSYGQEIKKENFFFLSSLHYTAKGMGYWYDKANGGFPVFPIPTSGVRIVMLPGAIDAIKSQKMERPNIQLKQRKTKSCVWNAMPGSRPF
jgi:hypothetical protein